MATNYINIVVTGGSDGGILTISKNGGNASINFVGNPGQNYIIQRSEDLIGWTNISTNAADGSGFIQFSEIAPHVPVFYRTQQE